MDVFGAHVGGRRSISEGIINTLRFMNGTSFLRLSVEMGLVSTGLPLIIAVLPPALEGVWPVYTGKEKGHIWRGDDGRRGTIKGTGDFFSYISAKEVKKWLLIISTSLLLHQL